VVHEAPQRPAVVSICSGELSMAYSLLFWRETSREIGSPESVSECLAADEEHASLAWLSVVAIKSKFATLFPGIDDCGCNLDWEGSGSYFQVTWPISSRSQQTQAIYVECGYELLKSPEVMNRIIELAGEFGCALYDPQTGERYEQPDPRTE
jgi:hypothetical protein